MSSKAQNFAAQVIAAFEAAGRYTDKEIGDAQGPSTTTMTQFRKVANGERELRTLRGDTFAAIDAAANWEKGSARALWHQGREPRPAVDDRRDVLARLDDIERRIRALEADRSEVDRAMDALPPAAPKSRPHGATG